MGGQLGERHFVPVNVRWAAREVAASLVGCAARVLVVDAHFAPMVPALRELHPDLCLVIFAADEAAPADMVGFEELIDSSEPVPDARRSGEATAGLYYTGDTTGAAKGVMLTHTNMMTSALAVTVSRDLLPSNGRLLHAAPLFHVAGSAAWAAQSAVGGTHVIVPAFEPTKVLATMAETRVTTAMLVPTMIGALLRDATFPDTDLSSLRHLIYGTSPISESLLGQTMQHLPGVGLTQIYGMTELSPVTTMLDPDEHLDAVRRRSAGRAASHVEVQIFEPQDVEVPTGSIGEIVVRGPHVMKGYWNQPEITAETLRHGWMHTGDAGYMEEEGYVYLVDRIKDMIVTGGENVYSVEVENALSQHPGVQACAVIGIPDERLGEAVHAVVVLEVGAEPTTEELRDFCKELIAGYKAPRSIEFVAELPLSAAGKVLKQQLRAPHWPSGGTQRQLMDQLLGRRRGRSQDRLRSRHSPPRTS